MSFHVTLVRLLLFLFIGLLVFTMNLLLHLSYFYIFIMDYKLNI